MVIILEYVRKKMPYTLC